MVWEIQVSRGREMNSGTHPKLFAVCFVKNEEDIIADCLGHAAKFCDRIYVIDNASTDRTWEIVKSLQLGPLVPVGSREFLFRDYLRVWFMEEKKKELGQDNWWYILDADDILTENPIEVILRAEEEKADVIAVNVINFHMTREEVEEAWNNHRQEGWRDRKYYSLYESGVTRFFKNTKYLNYGACSMVPFGLTRECSIRPPLKHFSCRSERQLEKRIRARYQNREFASEYKKGVLLNRYLVDPARPEIRRCQAGQAIDLSGQFSRVVPRVGSRGRDRVFSALSRTLYPISLLPLFHRGYNRYAAWRQNVDLSERDEFLSLF